MDGNGGAPLRDALIVIQGSTINTVARKGQASYPRDAQVLQADGKYIAPGLVDAHVHYGGHNVPDFQHALHATRCSGRPPASRSGRP